MSTASLIRLRRPNTKGNKVAVDCGFTAFDEDVSGADQVDRTVPVFGEFSLDFGGGDGGDLNFCLPLTGR